MTDPNLQHLNPKRSALIFIEYQNEWIDENGKLHSFLDTDHLPQMMKSSQRLIQGARTAKARIVHIGFKFDHGYAVLGEPRAGLNKLTKEYAAFSGNGSQYVEPFVPREDEFEAIGRVGISAFAGSNLDTYLRNQGVDTLFLAGFTLHACVESTLRDAHDRGYVAVVVDEATETFQPQQRDYITQAVIPQFGLSATVDEALHFFNR